MKILLLSDSHYYNDILYKITKEYKNKVDLLIHCGDSSIKKDDPLIKEYLTVIGNHDHDDYPEYLIYNDILITHGHLYDVYLGYERLIKLCKEHNCKYCFHGHTHIPTHQIHEDIHFINPGSIMMNRGTYGYGSFSIVEINENHIEVHFYHHDTFEQCDDIIQNGYALLSEIKEMIKASN